MPQPIDINSLSLETAKSLAYDELAKIETAQKNLQVLNSLIQQKSMPLPMAEPQPKDIDGKPIPTPKLKKV